MRLADAPGEADVAAILLQRQRSGAELNVYETTLEAARVLPSAAVGEPV